MRRRICCRCSRANARRSTWGYNLRSETVIQRLTGADVTAYITHIDSDLPMRRGVPFRTLYGTSPYVSWVAREQFLLERGAATIGYDAHGAVLGQADVPSSTVQQMQTDAMRFVADMADTFGVRLMDMHFRPQDGCAAFEHFLHTGALPGRCGGGKRFSGWSSGRGHDAGAVALDADGRGAGASSIAQVDAKIAARGDSAGA